MIITAEHKPGAISMPSYQLLNEYYKELDDIKQEAAFLIIAKRKVINYEKKRAPRTS